MPFISLNDLPNFLKEDISLHRISINRLTKAQIEAYVWYILHLFFVDYYSIIIQALLENLLCFCYCNESSIFCIIKFANNSESINRHSAVLKFIFHFFILYKNFAISIQDTSHTFAKLTLQDKNRRRLIKL